MDEREFDEFYAGSFRKVTSQVYAMIGDLDEATECVQEAFVRAWAHRRKLSRADYPEAWVRTTAYRLAVSRWRRRRTAQRPPDRALGSSGVTPEVDASHVALVAALRQATARDGVVVPELVRQFRQFLPPEDASYFHVGTTSQDVAAGTAVAVSTPSELPPAPPSSTGVGTGSGAARARTGRGSGRDRGRIGSGGPTATRTSSRGRPRAGSTGVLRPEALPP